MLPRTHESTDEATWSCLQVQSFDSHAELFALHSSSKLQVELIPAREKLFQTVFSLQCSRGIAITFHTLLVQLVIIIHADANFVRASCVLRVLAVLVYATRVSDT